VFGIIGNYNRVNTQAFAEALRAHVVDPAVEQILGTYHREPVIHYLDLDSRINVIPELDGTFKSAWELSKPQFDNVKDRGHL
jgi:hypothetical protein